MTTSETPGFQLGDQVFLADGQSGAITASRVNEDTGELEHLVEGVFEFFTEAELMREPAPVSFLDPVLIGEPPLGVPLPAQPPGEFVTFGEMRDFVVALIRLQPDVEVNRADLEQLRREVQDAANLTAQANLALHVSQVEGRAADLDLFIAARFSEVESTVTTTLSEIEKRSTDLETAAEEASGFGFFGFVGGLGGLLKDPVEWIMSRLGDHIRNEVNDGLNR